MKKHTKDREIIVLLWKQTETCKADVLSKHKRDWLGIELNYTTRIKKKKVTQQAEMNQEIGGSKSSLETTSVAISKSQFVIQ